MQYRRVGNTDITVSAVGIGCARLGGVFSVLSRADTVRLVADAVERGISFFDTADMYSQGESETLLGEALAAHRHRVVIATKVGYTLPAQGRAVARVKPLLRPLLKRLGVRRSMVPAAARGALAQNFSSDYILEAAHRSLKRLRTDYIDVYQLHSPPSDVLSSGDFLEPLEKLRRQGKVRCYGVACQNVADALMCLRYPELATVQVAINLLDQEGIASTLAAARAAELGVIARQCFASGLLTRSANAAVDEMMHDPAEREAKRRAIETYAAVADRFGRTLPELAVQFVLGQQAVSTVLLGIRLSEHLDSGLRYAASAPLSEEELTVLAHLALTSC